MPNSLWFARICLFVFCLQAGFDDSVPFVNLVGNLGVGDFFLITSFLICIAHGRVRFGWASIFPLLIGMVSLCSWVVASATHSPFFEPEAWGYIGRWFFYAVVILTFPAVIVNESSLLKALSVFIVGLAVNLAVMWYYWSEFPRYYGTIPILDVIVEDRVIVGRNNFGYFNTYLMLLLYCLVLCVRKVALLHLFIFCLFLLSVISNVFTFSKGTWLVSLFGLVALPAMFAIFRGSFLNLSYKKFSVLGLFLIGALLFLVFADGYLAAQLNNFFDSVESRLYFSYGSNLERASYASNALAIMADHPFLGVGPKGYLEAGNAYFGTYTRDPHNAFLWLGAEIGLFGLLIFVWCLVVYYPKLMLHLRSITGLKDEYDMLWFCILLSLWVSSIMYVPLTGYVASSKLFWISLAMLVTWRNIADSKVLLLNPTSNLSNRNRQSRVRKQR